MKAALKILSASALLATVAPLTSCTEGTDDNIIGRNDIALASDTLTPEALWAMGRIGSYAVSPDGKQVAYQVTYYSVEEDRSNTLLYVQDLPASDSSAPSSSQSATVSSPSDEGTPTLLGLGSSPAWLSDDCIAFASKGEVWTMNAKGKARKQLTKTDGAVEGFLFSPDQKKVILIKSIPFHDIIQERPADLPKSTGRVITDVMYRHWDHYVESIPHPFVLDLESGEEFDILEGQPFECPMEPFGGIEQLAWSPDSKAIAYTCRTKTGLAMSISTDSDIFLFDVETHEAKNLCKPVDYQEPQIEPSKTMKYQEVNAEANLANNPGYDQNPSFSPDGRYVAWLSMERNGYEADRQRLCICDLQSGEKRYVTESFDSNVDDFVWAADSHTLYYIGVWHATVNLYRTDLEGNVAQLTNEQADWGALATLPSASAEGSSTRLLMERHDFFHPADLYLVSIDNTYAGVQLTNDSEALSIEEQGEGLKITQLTHENEHILSQLAPGSSEPRWCPTTDGQQLLYWVIKPPHFDPSKKYPTLLFCEGGPQSPVSQFWSYRWNFYIMASQGYVIIAPNRRGLPGFGQEWLEENFWRLDRPVHEGLPLCHRRCLRQLAFR